MLSFSHGTLMLDVNILCVAGSVASVAASDVSTSSISSSSSSSAKVLAFCLC